MSIHDFHSKLMSGKEEGRLVEALRKMAAATSWMAQADPEQWTVWMEDGIGEGAGSLCEAGA